MCFQRSLERIKGESRPLKPGWKVIPQSRTASRETPVAKFVVCSWDKQLPDVVGMRSQRATTSIRQKMTVVSEIRGSSTSERLMHEPRDLKRHMLYAMLSKQRDSEQCQCHIIVNNATRHDTHVVSLTNEVGQCNVVSEDDVKLE